MAHTEPLVMDGHGSRVTDTFRCSRWRCTMSKGVCLRRRELGRSPVNRFGSDVDPLDLLTYQNCLWCEQGDRIGLEFGIQPPRRKAAETERKCTRCGRVQPIGEYSKYTYHTGWERVCRSFRNEESRRYGAAKRARLAQEAESSKLKAERSGEEGTHHSIGAKRAQQEVRL